MTIEDVLATYATRCPMKPAQHQVLGTSFIATLRDLDRGRVWPGCLMLGDEMAVGKTKQAIDGAQVLAAAGEIDTAIVLAPAPVRSGVWYHPELGQMRRHLWPDLPSTVVEYHGGTLRSWRHQTKPQFTWFITNYEYLANSARLDGLIDLVKKRSQKPPMLVLDESSLVKNWQAARTRAAMTLRALARNVVLMNGTPISESPADMYSQGLIMDPRILDCKNWWNYRGRYAVLGGFQAKAIVGWKHAYRKLSPDTGRPCCDRPIKALIHSWDGLGDIQRRFQPYVLRRLLKDCWDLPPALEPTTAMIPLSKDSWRIYKEMRDDMLSYLGTQDQSATVSRHGGTKVQRLAQICSGFAGGIEVQVPCDCEHGSECLNCGGSGYTIEVKDPKPIGSEKLDYLTSMIEDLLHQEPSKKILAWCRFRPELERTVLHLRKQFPKAIVVGLYGGQTKTERAKVLALLDPRTTPQYEPVIVVGTESTGALGLDLTAAHIAIYISHGTKLGDRLQSMARIHRPGQTHPVSYTDFVATGPDGQKTVNHAVLAALRRKDDVASWTAGAWVHALTEE